MPTAGPFSVAPAEEQLAGIDVGLEPDCLRQRRIKISPVNQLEHQEQILPLREFIHHLSKKKAEAIHSLYGIEQETETTTELAERPKVSPSAISQRHRSALSKLSRYLRENYYPSR
jgi:DNA-directed RNA polymerase specialized sigma subunit